jgi:hypothetical protein
MGTINIASESHLDEEARDTSITVTEDVTYCGHIAITSHRTKYYIIHTQTAYTNIVCCKRVMREKNSIL